MKKLSKDVLDSFDKDIYLILSTKRLEGYEGDIQKYYQNRLLALQVGHKIAEIEIFLRNKLDFCLVELEGEEWIRSERALLYIEQKGYIDFQGKSNHQILSSLMLGEVIRLIEEYKIETNMFDLSNLDFRKYHWGNNNFFRIRGKKTYFSNIDKNIIVFNLIRTIRNRAFHWENLLKVRVIDEKIYPRLVTIYPKTNIYKNQTIIGLMPEMILDFLDDLIDCINNEVMKKYRSLEKIMQI